MATLLDKFDKKYMDRFMAARKAAAMSEDLELLFDMVDTLADIVFLQRTKIHKLESKE